MTTRNELGVGMATSWEWRTVGLAMSWENCGTNEFFSQKGRFPTTRYLQRLQLLKRGLGCGSVVALSSSEKKRSLAERSGADVYLNMSDVGANPNPHVGTLDLILDTIPVDHDTAPYHALLKPHTGKLVMLGAARQTFGAYVASML